MTKYDPVKYKRFERDPIGCFEAHMMADGWAETKYVNDTSSVLLSVEVSEFIRLVHHLFKECEDWQKLQKFANKHGTEIHTDDYSTIQAFNILGDVMDYTVHINGTTMNIFPYRKYQH